MTDATTEAVARALCSTGPYNPDVIGPNGGAWWKRYDAQAEAAISAHLKALEADGMVIVPAEPSNPVAYAGGERYREIRDGPEVFYTAGMCAEIYRAMIAATATGKET